MAVKYTKEQLLRMLEKMTVTDGYKPTCTNWQRQGYPNMATINRNFGGWNGFLKEAGITKIYDLTGKKFGRLTAMYQTTGRIKKRTYWHCVCECGNELDVMSGYLTGGDTKSCGCLKQEFDEINLREKYEETRVDGVVTALTASKKRADNKSKVKGVHIRKLKSGELSYHANIGINGKTRYLGAFETLELAKEARKVAERRYHQPAFIKYKRRIGKTFTVEKGIVSYPLLQGGWHYKAFYRVNGTTLYLGRFITLESAVRAREAKKASLSSGEPNNVITATEIIKSEAVDSVKIHEVADDALIDEIRKLARKLGKRPSQLDYEDADLALEKYGSWALFLQRAGIRWDGSVLN